MHSAAVTAKITCSGLGSIGAVWITWRLTPLQPRWTWRKVLIRTVVYILAGGHHAYVLFENYGYPKILAGTPHPHNGVKCSRVETPNMVQARHVEQLARDDKHTEFSNQLAKNEKFEKDFSEQYGSLLKPEPVYVAGPFFENVVKQWFVFFTAYPGVKYTERRRGAVPLEQKNIIRHLIRRCSTTSPLTDCEPYFKSHDHKIVFILRPPEEFYKVINSIFPIPLGDGNFRFIIIDVIYTNRILKYVNGAYDALSPDSDRRLDETSKRVVSKMLDILLNEEPFMNPAWWPRNYHDKDIYSWTFDKDDFDRHSDVPRILQIMHAFLCRALHQGIGLRYSEVMAVPAKPADDQNIKLSHTLTTDGVYYNVPREIV